MARRKGWGEDGKGWVRRKEEGVWRGGRGEVRRKGWSKRNLQWHESSS